MTATFEAIGVPLVVVITTLWGVVKFLAPAWLDARIAAAVKAAVGPLEARITSAEAIHGDLREMKGTMQVLADNSIEAVRVTRELATVLGEVKERVAVVEAKAEEAPVRRRRG